MTTCVKTSNTRVYLAYLFLALVWGTGWYAVRLCVAEGGYGVLGGAALRYSIAALFTGALIPMIPRAFGDIDKRRIGWIFLAGLFNAAAMGLLYWGEKTISGGLAAVLVATSPFMAVAITLITRSERVKIHTLIGFALALTGVALIFAERLAVSPSHLLAMVSLLGSAFFFAIVNFIIKMKAKGATPLQSSVVLFFSMSIVFWLASPCEGPAILWPPPAVPTGALVYLSVACSALAFPVFCYLLRHSSLLFASTLAFVHPVVALITDGLLEKSFTLTTSAYLGICVVLTGVILSMLATLDRKLRVAATDSSIESSVLEFDPETVDTVLLKSKQRQAA
ncbi:MAG TPA: DMT family transporter [Candidatus Obscuribacterales bacterium]